MFRVDVAQVAPANVDEYLRVVGELEVPVMTDAGATFVSCWATSKELGEDVDIQVVWSFDDHAAWNAIRKNLVLDPRWYAYGDKLARLRTGGRRRFFHPTDVR
jgi:hypothetical protein